MIRAACLRHGVAVSRSIHRYGISSSVMSSSLDHEHKRKNETIMIFPAFSKRGFATNTADSQLDSGDEGFTTEPATPSFDDTMTKLFSDTNEAPDAIVDSVTTVTSTTAFDPTWYNLADQAINVVNLVHDTTGLSYSLSIVGVTTAVRVLMLPLFIKSQQNTSRMAHMQPEMQALKTKLEALGPNPDQETQVKYGLQMKALFKKYDCNPLRALALPVIQMPVFMGMFFGLRKMPIYFPQELQTGGMLWFPDLTIPDPLYILPIGSALSFLVMIELGKEQMMATNPQQGQIMLNVFRGLSIVMIPVAINFSSAVLCYWVTNNTFSLLQSMAFRNASVRKILNIWDPPKPVPGMNEPPKSIGESIQQVIKKTRGEAVTEIDRIQQHNQAIESKKKASVLRSAGRNRKRKSRIKDNKGR